MKEKTMESYIISRIERLERRVEDLKAEKEMLRDRLAEVIGIRDLLNIGWNEYGSFYYIDSITDNEKVDRIAKAFGLEYPAKPEKGEE